jgi:hypothetical protein
MRFMHVMKLLSIQLKLAGAVSPYTEPLVNRDHVRVHLEQASD